MNKSVYTITLSIALSFFIGFFIVQAMNRVVLMPMKIVISVNSKEIVTKDTLVVSSSDVLSLAHLKKTGDKSLTEWQINGESKALDDEFTYTFKEPGLYTVTVLNSSYIPTTQFVFVETPDQAIINIEGGPNYRLGKSYRLTDLTENVETRQWMINGILITDNSDAIMYRFTKSGKNTIHVINQLENGKMAMAEIQLEVEGSSTPKTSATPSGAAGGGTGGGGSAASPSSGGSGLALIHRHTNIGYSVRLKDELLTTIDSKDGKVLREAVLTASSAMNISQFAVIGKTNKGKITVSVLNKKGDIIESHELSCKPQNLYFSFNDGSGIDVKSGDILKIWIQLEGGAEIAFVPQINTTKFTPYPGFNIDFEKEACWMFDLEVWTP
jgi:hypothetical protein